MKAVVDCRGAHDSICRGVVAGEGGHIAVLLRPCISACGDCITADRCEEWRETDVLGPFALLDEFGE